MTKRWRRIQSGAQRRLLTGVLLVAGIGIVAVIAAVVMSVFGNSLPGQDAAPGRDDPGSGQPDREVQHVEVQPTLQSTNVSGTGDVADTAVVWLHPTDSTQSLILAGSKDETDGGLHVWEMDGTAELEFLPIGAVNSIDVRYGFPYDGGLIDLIGLTNRTEQEVQFFTIDPDTRELSQIGSHLIDSSDIYGFCLAHDQSTDTFYSIPNTEGGIVEQWEISASGTTIDAVKVRTIDVGSQTEGATADDSNGSLFIGEEDVGIWRYELDPSSGSSRGSVDTVSDNPDLAADVEGLALYQESSDQGYLIASSQGNSTFTVYEREPPHDYVGSFALVPDADEGVDAVTETDGISVTSRSTSTGFPRGVFVAHDGSTGESSTNYKLVAWEDIASALSLREPDG